MSDREKNMFVFTENGLNYFLKHLKSYYSQSRLHIIYKHIVLKIFFIGELNDVLY